MKRKGLWNALFIILSIILVVVLGGMLSWGMKRDAAERKRLETLATETVKPEKQEKPVKTEKPVTEEVKTEPKEEAAEETTAIVCFGNELPVGAGSSYKTVLEKTLQENGYTYSMISVAENEKPEIAKDSIPVICVGYEANWNGDVQALIKRQEEVLASFQNPEQYLIVGIRPKDDSIRTAVLDPAMTEKWGEHYISASMVTGVHVAASAEGQDAIGKAVFNKLVELDYIHK